MDKKLLEILVCPKCHGKLEYDGKRQQLVCHQDKLAFPVRDGIPVLLEDEAEALDESVSAE